MGNANETTIRIKSEDDTRQGFQSAENNAEGFGQKLGGMFAKVGPMLAAGALAAGALAGAALIKSVMSAVDKESATAKLGAQLGMNKAEMERAGKLAGEVYANNFGSSVENVNEAIKGVSRNISDMSKTSNADMKSMTEKALILSDVFGQDLSESTRTVGKMLKTGMAKDATEAFDILTRGFQTGADEAGDLLEVFSEYSTQFRDLGLTGKEAMGMLSQGLKAGARDADIVADALKEFAIRSKDGSKLSAEGFKAIGMDAERMFAIFARGGRPARDGLAGVLEGLQAIEDPVKRDAAAVALFGTQAEDLQDALYALNPDTAVAAMGQVAGAAKKAGDTVGATWGSRWETVKRKAMASFTEFGDRVLDVMSTVEKNKNFKSAMTGIGTAISFVRARGAELWEIFKEKGVPVLKELSAKVLPVAKRAFHDIRDAIKDNEPALREIWARFKILTEFVMTKVWPTMGPIASTIFKLLGAGISSAIRAIAFLSTAFRNMAGSVLGALRTVLTGVGNVARVMGKLPGPLGAPWRAMASAAERGKGAIDAVLGALERARRAADVNIGVNVRVSGAAHAQSVIRSMRQFGEFAHGGIVGAETGGARGGLTMVGEHGRELVRLPFGSTVIPNGATENMLAANGGGGRMRIEVSVAPNMPSGLMRELVKALKYEVRIIGGGNVQEALGAQ